MKERNRRGSLVPFDQIARDVGIPGEEYPASEELAYRRGFQQGACEALYALQRGTPFPVVWHWAQLTLRKWRTKGHPWRTDTLVKCQGPPLVGKGAGK
jgi:hypothetical protein